MDFTRLAYTSLYVISLLIVQAGAVDKTVCDGLFDLITCPIGQIIQINSVMFGRLQAAPCNYINQQFPVLTCRSTSVSTSAVSNSCQGRSTCVVMADSSFLNEDPCPGTSKYLQINFQCVYSLGQPVITTTVAAANPITFPPVTAPITAATTPSTTPSTTTQAAPVVTQPAVPGGNPFLPPGIIPIGVGGGIAGTGTIGGTGSGGGSSGSTANLNNHSGFNIGNAIASRQTGVNQCHENLISGPRGVPDSQLSASSRLALANNAHRGRLYTDVDTQRHLEGAWTPDPNDQAPWIQAKMNWLTVVHGITTQGRHVDSGGCCAEWTTSYTVQYSQDGAHWDTIKDAAGQDKVFVGNTDSDTPITHLLDCPVSARYVRLLPVTHQGAPSLRFDVIGCPTNTPDLGACPPHYKERPGSSTCYYISDQTDRKRWEDAMVTCSRQQGNLVKIDSAAEKQWLLGELGRLQASQGLTHFWTGLNNRPRRDNLNYAWHDRASLNTAVLGWRPGDPNNQGGIEHCGEYITSGDVINDRDCEDSLPYICEMSKYWLTPVRQGPTPPTRAPAAITTTVAQSTLGPTTMPNKLPVPVGGSLYNTGRNNFTQIGNNPGCLQASDCAALNMPWGDYPSCSGCGYYMTCAPNGPFDMRCPLQLKFDANLDRCSVTSSNCVGP